MNHPLPSPRLLSLLILVFASSVPGCGSTSSTLHAQGTIATQTMTARVDHPVARDYLEGRPLPASLEALRRAHVAEERLPSESTLTELTTRFLHLEFRNNDFDCLDQTLAVSNTLPDAFAYSV